MEGWFDKPVPVAIGLIGDVHHVLSARQADDLLTGHWPRQGTMKHKAAHRACLDAILGGTGIEAARLAFVEAAREAAVLADGEGPMAFR